MSDKGQPMPVGDAPASELEVLVPDHTLTLSDAERVTVHEYSFMEGLRVDALAGGLIKPLQDLFLEARADGENIRLQDLATVFGADPVVMSELLAMACDRTPDWVRSLQDADGQLLMLAWWNVNRSFFVRRLVSELGARLGRQEAPRQAGADSSPD